MPIGPAPVTSTRAPISGPACFAACRQTASGSAKAANVVSMPSGSTTARAASQTSVSVKPPCTCGSRIALP
ncbi:hypothetical protein [Dankookia sp. P2]|uniref:hypothetical protein n=1 Tax=Dankookia sp. P2 TaxID=3423955 RepID=UPI003D67BEAD